jgi:hypothetical protein
VTVSGHFRQSVVTLLPVLGGGEFVSTYLKLDLNFSREDLSIGLDSRAVTMRGRRFVVATRETAEPLPLPWFYGAPD